MPKQLTEDEINIVVSRVISEMGATNPSLMGQVIGAVKKELGSSADGAMIAQLVKKALN